MDEVARSRTFVMFSGTAGQVQRTFGAAIHRYRVNGETHYANATDPQIPAALDGLVAGIRGLHDFRAKPQLKKGPLPQMNVGTGQHELAPDDFATIFDITPMYAAGIDGSGQSVAVVGQSELYNAGADITAFWNKFNITSAKLVQKLVGHTPGVVPDWVDEASLDIEWVSAVARNATVVYVYSDDGWTSALHVVDGNLAPVLSMSYDQCEMFDLTDMSTYRALVQQANAQGITWLAASGDRGAAGCEYLTDTVYVAESGLGVAVPASIPEVTAMGGSQFNEGSGSYWSTVNTANGASAQGYIPEVAWNESGLGYGMWAGGGGASLYFPQPAWQTAGGVPNDGARHVPDLAFPSAVFHDGYYMISQGVALYVGGTSVATPTMAGVVALLNQYLVTNGVQSTPGLGNINPILYGLARTAPSAFHDITSGNNMVPCVPGSPDCSNGSLGYSAGPGYDSVTGLGSVDVANLLRQWKSQPDTASLVVPSIDQNPVFQTTSGPSGDQWTFQLTLTEEAGIGTTLTAFTINGTSYTAQIAALFGTASIDPHGSISGGCTLSLTTVPANETFGFSGIDASGATWTTSLTVPFTGPQTNLSVAGAGNAASGRQVFAPGMIMSIYGSGFGDLVEPAGTTPLPEMMGGFEALVNGYVAPLYYVSPNQVNLQIPYEVSPGAAVMSVGNPWKATLYHFTVSAAAPGIFTFPDGSVNPWRTGSAGQESALYVTGEGRVTPSLADGASPAPGTPLASLPQPSQSVSVTVGGIAAPVVFKGITSGLVGVTQINFTIPANVSAGVQPVVVTVGTAVSQPAYITIQ